MKYISRSRWVDVTDGHEYQVDEPFPHDGRSIPEKRLEELTGAGNQTGSAVITAVEVTEKKPKEAKEKK